MRLHRAIFVSSLALASGLACSQAGGPRDSCRGDSECAAGLKCTTTEEHGVCWDPNGDVALPGPCYAELPVQEGATTRHCRYGYFDDGTLASLQFYFDDGEEVTERNLRFLYAAGGALDRIEGDAILSSGFGGCDVLTWTFNEDGSSVHDTINDDCGRDTLSSFARQTRRYYEGGWELLPLQSFECDFVFQLDYKAEPYLTREDLDMGADGSIEQVTYMSYELSPGLRTQYIDDDGDGVPDRERVFKLDPEGRILDDEFRSYEYNQAGQLISWEIVDPGYEKLDSHSYYDAAGNLVISQVVRRAQNPPVDDPTARQTIWYDYGCHE